MRIAPLAALLLAGCATPEAARTVVGHAAPLSTAAYPALAADAAVTVTTGEVTAPYREVAVVVVEGSKRRLSGAEEVAVLHERLREEARRLGAHAVVRVAYHNLGVDGTHATGTAVRVGAR